MSNWNVSIPQQQLKQQESWDLGYRGAQSQSIQAAPKEYGLSSALIELQKEIGVAGELAYNLVSVLGVAEDCGASPTPDQPKTHFGAIQDQIQQVRIANARISRAIQHLNS